jgi:hypothetical protein
VTFRQAVAGTQTSLPSGFSEALPAKVIRKLDALKKRIGGECTLYLSRRNGSGLTLETDIQLPAERSFS